MRDTPWLVGCGSADITGQAWGAGMMGYGMRSQRTAGLHLRQRSRAFAVVDRSTGHRVVLVVADIGMFFANVREAVLQRLDLPSEDLLLTATHTHTGPGGFAGYRMYNTTNRGVRRVERRTADGWRTVARDGSWSTTVRWRRHDEGEWVAAVSWQAAAAGEHRMTWVGRDGGEHPIAAVAVV